MELGVGGIVGEGILRLGFGLGEPKIVVGRCLLWRTIRWGSKIEYNSCSEFET